MGIPFITMDAHNIVNDNVAQGCGYPNKGQIVEVSAEGPVVSFETNIEAPLVSLEAQIVVQQSGSGTPSPENVRPISGFDNVIITNNDIATEIDLPDTVYGGRLNVTTGELTITHKILTALSVKSVSVASGIFYWSIGTDVYSITNSDIISSHFIGFSKVIPGNCYVTANGRTIVAVPTDQTLNNKELADQWCEENRPQFVYLLSNPTTVQLTPTEVNTIIGRNNISANTGDVSLTYIRVNK